MMAQTPTLDIINNNCKWNNSIFNHQLLEKWSVLRILVIAWEILNVQQDNLGKFTSYICIGHASVENTIGNIYSVAWKWEMKNMTIFYKWETCL